MWDGSVKIKRDIVDIEEGVTPFLVSHKSNPIIDSHGKHISQILGKIVVLKRDTVDLEIHAKFVSLWSIMEKWEREHPFSSVIFAMFSYN